MGTISRCLGLLVGGSLPALLLALACGEGSVGELFPADAGIDGPLDNPGGRGGRGGAGRGGRAGSGGSLGGTSGSSGVGASDAGLEPGDAGECTVREDCSDGNECTDDICEEGACLNVRRDVGTACGDGTDDLCTAPDSCNEEGACVPNHAPDGSECAEGSCAAGACVPGPVGGCPSVVVDSLPIQMSWRTVGGEDFFNTGAPCSDEPNTPDFAVVFTAPADGTYRFDAAGVAGDDDPDTSGSQADSMLTIVAGACAGPEAQQLACNDDLGGDNLDSRIELTLDEGDSVTIYVNEFGEVLPGGGSGTLSITEVDD